MRIFAEKWIQFAGRDVVVRKRTICGGSGILFNACIVTNSSGTKLESGINALRHIA